MIHDCAVQVQDEVVSVAELFEGVQHNIDALLNMMFPMKAK